MSERETRLARADQRMAILCGVASFAVLASPLIPYVFRIDTLAGAVAFIVANAILTVVLSLIGISLNHLAARNARIGLPRAWRRE